MISGLRYIPDFITDKQQEVVVDNIDKQVWSDILKRRVQHYGYIYDYTYKSINASMKAQELQPWMKFYAQKFADFGIFPEVADQVIINEYTPGQGINKHIDCQPCFKDTIASLSLLSGCTMEFTNYRTSEKKELWLAPKSLLVLSGEARNGWMHGIPARKQDNGVLRERRISATFRNVILSS